MKLKNLDPQGARVPRVPLDPPLHLILGGNLYEPFKEKYHFFFTLEIHNQITQRINISLRFIWDSELEFIKSSIDTRSSGRSRISPRRGRQLPRGGANIRFWQIFPKNAWNWKNLGPGGGCPSCPPLDPPLRSVVFRLFKCGAYYCTTFKSCAMSLQFPCFHFHAVFDKNYAK